MPAVTIRNLPVAVHAALKANAARHGRSTEAEIRSILESAVLPADRLRLGSAMAEISRNAGVTRADVETLEASLAHPSADPIGLE